MSDVFIKGIYDISDTGNEVLNKGVTSCRSLGTKQTWSFAVSLETSCFATDKESGATVQPMVGPGSKD